MTCQKAWPAIKGSRSVELQEQVFKPAPVLFHLVIYCMIMVYTELDNEEMIMVKKFLPVFFCLMLCAGLAACNLPVNGAVAPTETETLVPPSETPQSTLTATEAPTETPAATATETVTPEPSITPTPEIPSAEVFRETNCRTGPAGNYDLVAVIAPGTIVDVIGADLGPNYYWYIRNPDNPDEGCWLLAQNMEVTGDVSGLPALTPAPSPTQSPAIKVEFKKFDTCKGGFFARFVVTNVGDVQFRSAYIKVTDTKTNEIQQQSLNAFDLTEGCIIAKNIAPLTAGQVGYLDSPVFNKDPRDHRLTVVIMACTEQNLKGACVTQTLEVRP